MSKVKCIGSEWQSEVSGMAILNEGGGAHDSIATLIQDSFDIVTEAEASIQQYDSDGEIKADFDIAKAGDYSPETFPLKIQALHSYAKNAPTAVRNDIDQPFNMGLDDFLGAMSNAEVSKYSTPGLGSLSRTGIGGANQVARVSLSDLFQPQTVIGQALKREYIDMKNQVDGDFTYEDYVELSQNLASYSYDSFKEALAKGGVAFALTTAVTSIPVIGPIISLSMMGYGAVDGIYGYAFGKELLTGRELSEEEKILKGLLGVLYVGMLSMTAYNGLVNLKEQRAANKKAEKVVGPEKPNELSQRDKVLKNIEESKKARESSNFSDYLAKEKEILAKKASGANVNKPPRNLIDNMDEIADDIRNINKKYSSGLEQNNSIDSIINSASYYEDVWEQTSAVTRSVAEHAFVDGNKRTAFDTLNMLLDDLRLKSPLNDTQKWDLINRIGTGDLKDVSEIANILKGK